MSKFLKQKNNRKTPSWSDIEWQDISGEHSFVEGEELNTEVEKLNSRIDEVFQYVSSGKNRLETVITDKGGTVSKNEQIATFDELELGVVSIPSGGDDTVYKSMLIQALNNKKPSLNASLDNTWEDLCFFISLIGNIDTKLALSVDQPSLALYPTAVGEIISTVSFNNKEASNMECAIVPNIGVVDILSKNENLDVAIFLNGERVEF